MAVLCANCAMIEKQDETLRVAHKEALELVGKLWDAVVPFASCYQLNRREVYDEFRLAETCLQSAAIALRRMDVDGAIARDHAKRVAVPHG